MRPERILLRRRIGLGLGALLLVLALAPPAPAQALYDLLGLGSDNGLGQAQAKAPGAGPSAPAAPAAVPVGTPTAPVQSGPAGTPTQAGATVQAAVGSVGQLQPFGANLFTGAVPPASETPNPNYTIQVGDRVSIRVWGGVNAEATDIVDMNGSVFLTGVGPIHVGGTRAGELEAAVKRQLGSTFTTNVQVYAVLLGTHRVAVFVTGYVRWPGRYAGSASDSVLDYLVRAGGVDPSRGSYRNISLQRGGREVARVDLYEFLLSGKPLPINLQEGDIIVVAKQYPMVAVMGAVRNNYLFEMPGIPAQGKSVIDLARPLPAATHAFVTGTRDARPFSTYASLAELTTTRLYDQDQVSFVTDAPGDTVSIEIQGSRIGPSVLVADRDVRLADLLNYVAVDQRLADTKSVYLLRQSLAQQQAVAIKEALDRLQRSLFLAMSVTTGEAQIRASEAQLVQQYIEHARQVQPVGRLVVTDDSGKVADIRLENGDVIVIPEKSQVVLVSGEAVMPQAIIYRPGMTASQYVANAGGFTDRGTEGNYMIRRANGQIFLDSNTPLRPGDELIVMPVIGGKYFQLGKDLVQVIYEIAVASHFASGL